MDQIASGQSVPDFQVRLMAEALREIFGRMDDEVVAMLRPMVEFVEVAGGEAVVRQGGTDSDLYFVDLLHDNAVTPLALSNGFLDEAQAQSYVPAGARDLHKNFFPTVVPVAAGGYFWMFFTSRRTYGNIKTGFVDAADSKQLWVTALDIGGSGDISHPAFYLRGQELAAGNIRAFAALELRSPRGGAPRGLGTRAPRCRPAIPPRLRQGLRSRFLEGGQRRARRLLGAVARTIRDRLPRARDLPRRSDGWCRAAGMPARSSLGAREPDVLARPGRDGRGASGGQLRPGAHAHWALRHQALSLGGTVG
jgi:hypothetical protein